MCRVSILMALTLGTIITVVTSSKILFLSPLGSKSHKNFYMGIALALAEEGHEVSFLSAYPTPNELLIRDVVIPGLDFDKFMQNVFNTSMWTQFTVMMPKMYSMCSYALGHANAQALLEDDFDVVLISAIMADCFLPKIFIKQIPFIYLSPAGLFGPFATLIGSPIFPSFMVNPLLGYVPPLTFLQRGVSTLTEVFFYVVNEYYNTAKFESECQKKGLCSKDVPPLRELNKKASLIIVNGVRTLENPAKPYMPNVIHAGGIHCRPARPLPQDLDDWLAGAGEHGVILFSLGSVAKPSDIPEKVLWKWDLDDMDSLPRNVKISKWLPQQDILGDPRTKLFITHGGLLSTLEATYHAVPIIGMPLFADQFQNMEEGEIQGWAKTVSWKNLIKEKLENTINSVLHDKDFHALIRRRSGFMKDQPISPKREAVFWVEHVIRTGGAPHLASPLHQMLWYQLYNVDVWVALLALSVTLAIFNCFMLLWCCKRFVFRRKPKSKKD